MRVMSKMLMVSAAIVAAAVALPPNVLAQGSEQTDHMLLNFVSAGGGTTAPNVGYCGLATNAEPWTLHIAVKAGDSAASVKIGFQDGDSMTFPVPAGTSFSLTQALGGASGAVTADQVDNVVRIEISGSLGSDDAEAMVSARARPNTTDAFGGDGQVDNLCVNLSDEGPVRLVAGVLAAAGWESAGAGSDLQ